MFTGVFTKKEDLKKHIQAGAQYVVCITSVVEILGWRIGVQKAIMTTIL